MAYVEHKCEKKTEARKTNLSLFNGLLCLPKVAAKLVFLLFVNELNLFWVF